MQTTGHVFIGNKKLLLLVRSAKIGRSLKLRESGKDGVHLADEEQHLVDNPQTAKALLKGKTVYL